MTIISESLRKWLDLKRPACEPLRLKEGAPEEVKKEFEKWHRELEEYDARIKGSKP